MWVEIPRHKLILLLKKKWWLILIIFLFSFSLWSFSLVVENNFLSPLGRGFVSRLTKSQMTTVGFLPYWNINDSLIDFSVIDQLIYFGLTVGEDGHFILEENGYIEPGLSNLQNNKKLASIFKAGKNSRKKILFSAICFDPYIIDLVVSDQKIQENLIEDIIKVVKDYDFDGVDIDFEYFPGPNNIDDFGNLFANFLDNLNKSLKKIKPKAIISTDIYPKAFIYHWPYDLVKTNQSVDQIILMAYDFTQSNSPQAGPVAPIKSDNPNEMSIVRSLEASLGIVDQKKLILGIPLYGYEWRTKTANFKSPTYYHSGTTATYDRVSKLIAEKKLKVFWDEVAYSPWLVYTEGKVTKQIYFDNLKSIIFKVRLAKELNLKGIAFWALGYEGRRPAFWEEIKKEL